MSFWTKKIDGIIALVVGVLILIFPFAVSKMLALFIGVVLLISGVNRLYGKLRSRSKRLINSLLMIAIGIVLVFFYDLSGTILGYLVGGVLVYNGFLRLIKYNKIKSPMNKSLAGAGLVAMTIGVVIIIFPKVVAGIVIVTLNTIFALILIGYGVLRLFVKFNFSDKVKKFKDELDDDKNVVDVEAE